MPKLLGHSDSIVQLANRIGAGRLVSICLPEDPSVWQPLPRKFSASEEIVLGKTGIRTSLLAMGTGTRAVNGLSRQTTLGIGGAAALLVNGYRRGLRFIDTADTYGTHAHIAAAMKHLPREKITLLTKTFSRNAADACADIERFRRELNVDYLDICLMHCMREKDWTVRYRGVMDALSEAKERGVIRAIGCSCHGIDPLRAAAKSPWVEVALVRLNPVGAHMDARPETVIEVIREMRLRGIGIVGMKILAQGDLKGRPGAALHFALSSGVLDAITIGAESIHEQEDLIRRIASLSSEKA